MRRLLSATLLVLVSGTAGFSDSVLPENVEYKEGAVMASLSGKPGDPVAGREVFKGRKLGNCLACHENTEMAGEQFHGEIGPSLDGVADRWTEAELRGIVSNPKMVFDGTIMPAFYKREGLVRPQEKFEGAPILTAQQVEDVLAYLKTLKDE